MPDRFPPGIATALRHFNAGRFFEAHEAFEELLEEVEGDSRRWGLLLALVQVAVGYHKAVSGHPGAERMLRLGAEKLRGFPDVVYGVAVGRLRTRVADDLGLLAAGDSLTARIVASPPRIEMQRG